MISYGADVTLHTKDEREWTPLHMLASMGKDTNEYHGKIANLLLENGADPDSTTPLGYTPLHFIAMNGNLESLGVLQQLINFNANPYCTTSDGVTNWRLLWQHGEQIFETLHAYEKRYI
jgi:ankyrin repeat protein